VKSTRSRGAMYALELLGSRPSIAEKSVVMCGEGVEPENAAAN
jgi:hypothetical protein